MTVNGESHSAAHKVMKYTTIILICFTMTPIICRHKGQDYRKVTVMSMLRDRVNNFCFTFAWIRVVTIIGGFCVGEHGCEPLLALFGIYTLNFDEIWKSYFWKESPESTKKKQGLRYTENLTTWNLKIDIDIMTFWH